MSGDSSGEEGVEAIVDKEGVEADLGTRKGVSRVK
jgi:hypothetical protein